MKSYFLLGTAFMALSVAGPTLAQTASSSGDKSSTSDNEIIVTALRSETVLSKTPLAITAVDGEALRQAGISDARALSAVVPNFALTQDSYDARIAIRGVTSANVTETGDPSVAFLLNGIYIARPADMMGSFFDVERVEVLRGPQGTLYGRNTTAGVVNVITKKPTDKFEGSFDARVGNLSTLGATGMVNIPLNDAIGFRAAVTYDKQGPNILVGRPGNFDPDPYRDELSGRFTLGGTLGQNFDFVIRADVSQAGGTESGSFVDNSTLGSNFFTFNAIGVDPTYKNVSSKQLRTLSYSLEFPIERDDTRWGLMTELTQHMGAVDVTYLGGYRTTTRDDFRNFRVSGAFNNPVHYEGEFDSWSHELRVSLVGDSPLQAQAGLYYFDEDVTIDYQLGRPFAGNFGANVVKYNISSRPMTSTSKGVFGQVTYDITPELHVTGGMRYTQDQKKRDGGVFLTSRDPVSGAETISRLAPYISDKEWSSTTWKAGVDYDAPGLGLIYGSVSTGYKAGGFNDGCIAGTLAGCTLTSSVLYYNPEKITAYEAGFKFALFDRAVRFNLSAYHYDYADLQVSQFATTAAGATTRLVQNAAKAKVDGVEADVNFRPWTNGKVTLAGAYTNARYTDFVAKLASGASRNFNGLLLDHSAKWSGSISVEQIFPLSNGGDVTAALLSNLSSAYYIADIGILGQYRNPDYTKTDVSLTYNAPDSKWYLQAYGQNLEDNITISHGGSGAFANITIGQPRTYGVRAGFKY